MDRCPKKKLKHMDFLGNELNKIAETNSGDYHIYSAHSLFRLFG